MAQNHSENPGNFANDRARAAEAGHKGGQHSGGQHGATTEHKASGQHSQHGGNFAQDREKASEAGRKGGKH